MQSLMHYDIFDLAFMYLAKNIDNSVTCVKNPVDWRKLEDKFQQSSHLYSHYPIRACFFSDKLGNPKESSCEARIQIGVAEEGKKREVTGLLIYRVRHECAY